MSSVTDYIKQLDEPDRTVMHILHSIVHTHIPTIKDVTKYGVPAYEYKGKFLFGFAKTKTFLSLYPEPATIIRFEKELKDFVIKRGTISFTSQYPLPKELLTAIVLYRKEIIEMSTKQ